MKPFCFCFAAFNEIQQSYSWRGNNNELPQAKQPMWADVTLHIKQCLISIYQQQNV